MFRYNVFSLLISFFLLIYSFLISRTEYRAQSTEHRAQSRAEHSTAGQKTKQQKDVNVGSMHANRPVVMHLA